MLLGPLSGYDEGYAGQAGGNFCWKDSGLRSGCP